MLGTLVVALAFGLVVALMVVPFLTSVVVPVVALAGNDPMVASLLIASMVLYSTSGLVLACSTSVLVGVSVVAAGVTGFFSRKTYQTCNYKAHAILR